MTDELKARIDAMVRQKRVVLFMKGTPMMPMCGFSSSALATLRAAGATEIATFDVLRDPELRTGLKEYSGWPTIPQCFVDGELVGGCDILRAMHDQGELAPLVAPR
jgi:monothiol glutaredoxin